jgi:putative tricarboxylic transport membrane protein
VKYIPYNAGGHAMVGLLSGETQLLSTGLSEAIALADQREVRILAVTAPERLDRTPQVPTLVEQGVPAVFANWRGFFAAPGTSAERVAAYADKLARMYETDAWQRIRDARGWTDFYVSGADFAAFLEQQERDMAYLLRELSMLP